jgi:lipopolysaccharide transport system ATP-binding protein
MNAIAIRVEKLSKLYKIGSGQPRHDTLRDQISDGLRSLVWREKSKAGDDTFWALKDVSFSVNHGEVIGVIGRNGAGKSTLLKILSRITEPTGGYAEIFGRVGSLLEVGTGFHPELTGRENLYLNGAILGMKKAEINRKFDEIVAFSEIEKFLDTPVKRYSSGMYVRLAFAVAAHLEPEILIVDEVLAVGDAAFQKKCMGKIGDVAKDGRTVLFVSHNLPAILALCPTAILLDAGRVALRGPSATVIEQYLNLSGQTAAQRIWRTQELPKDCGPFRPTLVRVCNRSGATDVVRSAEPFYIEVQYELTKPIEDFRVQFKVFSSLGEKLFVTSDVDDPSRYRLHSVRQPGAYVSRCHIPANLLNRGVFVVGISAASPNARRYFLDDNCISFTVDGTGGVGSNWIEDRSGFFRPALDWDIEPAQITTPCGVED